jgi:hypothetical protein
VSFKRRPLDALPFVCLGCGKSTVIIRTKIVYYLSSVALTLHKAMTGDPERKEDRLQYAMDLLRSLNRYAELPKVKKP